MFLDLFSFCLFFSQKPWTEFKRRFWKNALGDEYESPSACYNTNTQDVTQVNDTSFASHATGRQLTFEPPNEDEADRNLQKLNEFINNRQTTDNDQMHNVVLPQIGVTESGKYSFLSSKYNNYPRINENFAIKHS